MALSNDLISQFVKITKDDNKTKNEVTRYATVKITDGRTYVQFDGADILTPIFTTTNVKDGDRVTVQIKNHSATITGNLSSPSANSDDMKAVDIKMSAFENIVAGSVTTEQLEAERARINQLIADDIIIRGRLEASEANIDTLNANNVTISGKLSANEATINRLSSTMITTENLRAEIANVGMATIEDLKATNAEIYRLEGVYGEFRDMTVGRLDVVEGKFDTLETDFATVEYLEANYASIDRLEVLEGKFESLDADYASIEYLEANYANIDQLEAVEGRFDDLDAKYASINHLEANYASIAQLEAVTGDIDVLNSDLADINTLIFGSASGNVIHSNFANAVVAQLGNAQIKSAMIESIAADKITAGDIITNNVKVKSADGSLVISDETMQISDDNRVRVQIGKDAAGDYSINIWDESGNLMFSKGGITDKAIKQAIIRNDMVANNANIAADKLDIDSLFDVINEDGSHTLKSSKIMMDGENQTLNVSFGQITTKVTETTTKADQALANANQAQESIDNLEIGGRNLLLKTNQGKTNWNYIGNDGVRTITEYVGTDGVRGVKLTNTTASSDWSYAQYNKSGVSNFLAKIEPNTEYTLSFDMMTNVSSSVEVSIRKHDATGIITNNKVITFTNDEKWHKYSVVLTTLSDVSDTTDRILYFGTLNTVGYYIIKNLKLEKGTKATDWTPAPEDVDSSISSVDTKATNAQTAANTASGKADAAQGLANAAQSAANKAQSDIDNLEIGGRNLLVRSTLSIGYLSPSNNGSFVIDVGATTYNKTSDYINVSDCNSVVITLYDSFVSSAIGRYCLYDAGKNHIKTVEFNPRSPYSEVVDTTNATYLRITAIGYDVYRYKVEKGNKPTDWTPAPEDVEAKITTITETVTSQGTDISVLQGQINSKIWQQDITTAVDGIEIGGRNLLYNSNFKSGFYRWVNSGMTVEPYTSDSTYKHAIRFYTPVPGNSTYRMYQDISLFTHVVGETYTLSFMAKADVNTQLQSNVAASHNVKNYDLTTSWQKFTHTYKATLSGSLTFWPNVANVWIYLTNIKLEKGTVATDWTPAPEDLEGEVQNLTTQYSELNQDLNEISATVGKHETDISGTKSQLSDLTVDLSGFKTTVSETYTTKSAFDALDVGTRNLIKGTNQGTTNWGIVAYNGTTTLSPVEALGVNALKIAVSAASTSYHVIINKGDLMALIKKGGIYTIAFDVYPSSDLTVWASYQCHDATNNCGYWSNKTCPANTWTHYESTITFNPNIDIINDQVIYLSGFNVVGEHIIANLMLVEGNKVGSWQPAPEDVEASITSAKETVIQQTNEAIALKASKTEVTTAITDAVNGIEIGGRNLLVRSTLVDAYLLTDGSGDISKISGAYNKTSDWIDVSDCDSVVISLYDSFTADSYYSGRYCLYDANKTCLTTVTFNPRTPKSVIAHTTNSSYLRITAIACQTYRYKIEKGNKPTDWTPAPEDVDANISALGNRVTSTEAALNVNSESITSVVKRTESLEKWSNDLEIGGRNLIVSSELIRRVFVNYTGSEQADPCCLSTSYIPVKPGDNFILQFWQPENSYVDSQRAWANGIILFDSNKNYISGYCVGVSWFSDAYKVVTKVIPDGCYYVRVSFQAPKPLIANADLWTAYSPFKVKLEKGNKPTDWTPASEDMATGAELTTAKSEIKQTTDAITSNVTAMDGRLSTVEQTASGLTVRVSNTENELANLEIGGRNLLPRTKTFEINKPTIAGSSLVMSELYKGLTVRYLDNTNGTSFKTLIVYYGLIEPEAGSQYTISFYAKGVGSIRSHFYEGSFKTVRNVSSQGSIIYSSDGCMDFTLTNEWTRYWVTYTLEDTNTLTTSGNKSVTLRIMPGNEVYACGLKLEKGNRATDWTPAPEDIDANIESAKQTVIEQTSEAIALKASKDDVTAAINNLEIGGRNLWLKTKEYDAKSYTGWVDNNDGRRTFTTVPHTTVNGFGVQRIASMWSDISQRVPIEPYTDYTLSAWIKWESEAGTLMFYDNVSPNSGKNVTTQVGTDTYKRVSVTFHSNNATVSTCRFECTTNIPYLIYGLKLEKGNRATDWSPAPEDIVAEAEASLQVTAEAIRGEVSGIDGRLTVVEQTAEDFTVKIKGIDSSISSVDTKANNAQSTANSSVNARNGYSIKWNCSAFSSKNDGEAYICAKHKTTNVLSDANGTVMFNGITRTVTKGMINPNANLPYNRTIYIVMRLSSASATTGTNYLVWYNSGWKYSGIDLATSSTISDWTWNTSTDIVLGSFVEPNSEAALVDCCIYEPPLTADQVTNGASAHILANNAQSTANSASGKADAAQSTANSASSKADTAQSMATAAGKTATNYMRFSQNGLVIGDYTAGTLGKNVLINNDSVNIRNGDKVLASYGDNTIRLGVEDYDSTISLCKDVGVISAAQNEVTGYYDILKISSKEGSIDINSKQGSTLTVHNSANGSTWGSYIGSFENNVHAMVYDFRDGEPLQGLTRFYLHPNVIEMDTQSSITGKYVHLNLDGYNGYIQASSEIISTNPNGFRIAYGNYGSFIRNDGNSTYFLLTNSGDIYGNWNSLRPLIINNSTGNVTINNSALDATGDITPGRDLLVKNGYSIFCKNTSGTQINALHMSSANQMQFGYGAYANGYLARYCGAAVEIGTPQGNFRPYFRPGDSVRLLWYGGGYITGSGKNLRYTIPLSKPAVGCSGVTVATANGYVIRQNGNYCYGSSASTTTKAVASSNGSIENNNHVRVQVEFDNNTNTTNNDGAGIEASITLTFV